MTQSEPPTTIAHFHPSGSSLGPAVEQLRVLFGQAVSEGRRDDAADYERMIQHLLVRMQVRDTDPPMWKKVVFSILLSTLIVFTVHCLV